MYHVKLITYIMFFVLDFEFKNAVCIYFNMQYKDWYVCIQKSVCSFPVWL